MVHPECLPAAGRKVLPALRNIVGPGGFVLAGGTGLALQLGHRVSEDLDFFTPRPFDTDRLFRDLRAAGLEPELRGEERGTLIVAAAGVKVSFFEYAYPFVERTVSWRGIAIAGVADIAAMDLVAVAQRGARRDFVDLYAVLRSVPFRLIAADAAARFGRDRVNPVHTGKSLVWFRDADGEPDPRYPPGREIAWGEVKAFFTANVRQMVLDLEQACGPE